MLEIARMIDVSGEEVRSIIAYLQSHDLVLLDEADTEIVYAYPFAGRPTEHVVEVGDQKLHAVCAIDALGVAAMLRTDTTIMSSCRTCGGRIDIGTAQNGRFVSHRQPAETVLWYDLAYAQTAAASCCPAIAFFCSDRHLREWAGLFIPAQVMLIVLLNEAVTFMAALSTKSKRAWGLSPVARDTLALISSALVVLAVVVAIALLSAPGQALSP
jgi:hypothetical protein